MNRETHLTNYSQEEIRANYINLQQPDICKRQTEEIMCYVNELEYLFCKEMCNLSITVCLSLNKHNNVRTNLSGLSTSLDPSTLSIPCMMK